MFTVMFYCFVATVAIGVLMTALRDEFETVGFFLLDMFTGSGPRKNWK